VSAARPSSGLASKSPVLAVTGGSGFIGLSLIEHLLKGGHSVLAHAMEPLPPMALATFADYPGRLSTVQGDIGDARLGQCLADHRVTHVFHGAAITAAQAREKVATRQILEVNLMGTVNALDACVHAGVQTVVLASSSAVYGAAIFEGQDLDESHPPAPANLYGIGKVAIEGIGQRYQALHGLRVTNARITAAFGPWERDTGLRDTLSPLWQIARRWALGQAVRLLPRGQRDWVYSPQVAQALAGLLLADELAHPTYNLSPGQVWHPELFCQALRALDAGFEWSVVQTEANIDLFDDLTRQRSALSSARARAEPWGRWPSPAQCAADYARWVLAHKAWFS
jgi:nucleoside-diphosphate-sugar epimerase